MSDLKSETARMNGAKSRGPTTPEGREKSSRNAVKHGFTSNSNMVLDCESSDQFHELLGDFFTTYQPASAVERDLVEEMVAARWRIRRNCSGCALVLTAGRSALLAGCLAWIQERAWNHLEELEAQATFDELARP